MTFATSIRQSLTLQLPYLLDNTIVIDNLSELDFDKIQNGVLIVYAAWSLEAIVNCTKIIEALYNENYQGAIIIMDIDCMTPDFQINTFGQVCHGWGETFVIKNQQITEKFMGKDNFNKFKECSDR